MSTLHIALVSAEVTPFVKTGGLGDIAGALPKALARLGHRVTVILPRYRSIKLPEGEWDGSVHVRVDGLDRVAGFYRARTSPGVDTVFVEYGPFFDRDGSPYGGSAGAFDDNHLRFAFLSRAAIEYFRMRHERPSAFHANDWHTGLLPVYLKAMYWSDPLIGRMPTVYSIHNLAYQGNFAKRVLTTLGFSSHLADGPALEFDTGIGYMKGGILFSERVNTVSPHYADEVRTPELGLRFDGILRSRGSDFVGILNGVDYDEWDPRVDRMIARAFSPEDVSGKAACKSDLLRAYGLPEFPNLPVVGITSRLVYQKGIDLVTSAWPEFLRRPIRIVMLGEGERDVQEGFRLMAAAAPDRVGVRIGYDARLAHKIEAGSDMFLVPSRFEPCGLTQMYSLRYGTAPIVRSTGGLVDTVEHHVPGSDSGTGFRFNNADSTALLWALDQALTTYSRPDEWLALQRRGMRMNFSWERSAAQYVDLYEAAAQSA
jgi:starch synthase